VLTEHNAPGVFVANLDDNVTIANLLTAATSAPRRGSGSRRPDERQAEAAAGGRGDADSLRSCLLVPVSACGSVRAGVAKMKAA
jgi:hypothetical protein